MIDGNACGIYEIRNAINGKRYIGSAKSFKKRWHDHKYALRRGEHHSAYLQRSWSKHGGENFEFRVILRCDKENLIFFEQRCIDSMSPEYNVCPNAGSTLGKVTSEETKRKLSIALSGRYVSAETRLLHSLASKGRPGRKWTAEQRAASSIARRGRPKPKRTPEHQAKITAKKRKLTPELVQKIRNRAGLGERQSHLAREFHVSDALISNVISRKKWA